MRQLYFHLFYYFIYPNYFTYTFLILYIYLIVIYSYCYLIIPILYITSDKIFRICVLPEYEKQPTDRLTN